MRQFINLVENADIVVPSVLTEAQDYMAMMMPILNLLSGLPEKSAGETLNSYTGQRYLDNIKNDIIDIRNTFRKNDRIVWLLRIYRIWVGEAISRDGGLSKEARADAVEITTRMNQQLQQTTGHALPAGFNWRELRGNLEHLIGLPVSSIQQVVWDKQSPATLVKQLDELEVAWKEAKGEKGTLIPMEPDREKAVINFPNGFAWVMLDRGACRAEADAMGHCGNAGGEGRGDRILSLRNVVKGKDGDYWQPFLTFILNKDGKLGEMKGRGNEKPAARYHKYILALLMDPMIKGVRGGGYLPENNFSVSDLTEEEQSKLFDARPEMATTAWYFKHKGFDDTLKAMIIDEFAGKSGETPIGWKSFGEKHYLVLSKFDNWLDAAEKYGNDTTKHYVPYLTGGADWNISIDDNAKETLWDDLPKKTQEAIKQHIFQLMKEAGDVPEDEEDDIMDELDSSSNIVEKITELDNSLSEALYMGAETGHQYGAEKQLDEAMESAFKGFDGPDGMTFFFDNPENKFMYDTAVELVMPLENAMKALQDEGTLEQIGYYGWLGEDKIKMQEPYYGFNDYDDKGAVDSFFEHVGGEYDFRPVFNDDPKNLSGEKLANALRDVASKLYDANNPRGQEQIALVDSWIETKPEELLRKEVLDLRNRLIYR